MRSEPAPVLPSDQDFSGRSLGSEELTLLEEVIRSGTLTSTKGTWVARFEESVAKIIGMRHAFACSSGTAAIHIALAAIGIEPGDEVITTPITDMGAIAPILFQGGIPVFADVDRRTLNITPKTAADRLSDRTKAIVATHLFGSPCDLEGFARLANESGAILIEDCSQAFLAQSEGRVVGTVGRIGCFSMQQGKHITTGEGGFVVTNDEAIARRLFLAINKAWGYGDPQPDHYFLALNFRLSELQGAVALAQLGKLAPAVERRIEMANRLTLMLAEVRGLTLPTVATANVHTYWRYAIQVDSSTIDGGAIALSAYLKANGVSSSPRYIQKPAYRCSVIADQRTFGTSHWPFSLARPEAVDYDDARFPGVVEGLDSVMVLPWNERYEVRHVEYLAEVISSGVDQLSKVPA